MSNDLLSTSCCRWMPNQHTKNGCSWKGVIRGLQYNTTNEDQSSSWDLTLSPPLQQPFRKGPSSQSLTSQPIIPHFQISWSPLHSPSSSLAFRTQSRNHNNKCTLMFDFSSGLTNIRNLWDLDQARPWVRLGIYHKKEWYTYLPACSHFEVRKWWDTFCYPEVFTQQ